MTVRQQWAVVGVVVAILATGLAAGVKLFADDLFPVGVGSSAPSFKAKDLASGATRTLADYRGQVVLLNVWATWCVPCRTEMPTLDRLQASLGGADFEVAPVSIDRGGLVLRHSDFDRLVWDQGRTGRCSGSTSISMLRATPGCLLIKPARSSVITMW